MASPNWGHADHHLLKVTDWLKFITPTHFRKLNYSFNETFKPGIHFCNQIFGEHTHTYWHRPVKRFDQISWHHEANTSVGGVNRTNMDHRVPEISPTYEKECVFHVAHLCATGFPCVHVWVAGAALPLYLLHEDEKRLAIVLPLLRQLALMREFVTAHIHRQLKAVGVQVAEIIHTCQERETRLSACINFGQRFCQLIVLWRWFNSEITLYFVFSLFVCLCFLTWCSGLRPRRLWNRQTGFRCWICRYAHGC